jgi:hypothetical protein
MSACAKSGRWITLGLFPSPQPTFFAAGGVQVPLMIEGGSSCGQYMRNMRINLSGGDGGCDLVLQPGGIIEHFVCLYAADGDV